MITNKSLIQESSDYLNKYPKAHWIDGHRLAMTMPIGFETAIVQLIHGAAKYADEHYQRHESLIGEDGILGPAWLDILKGIRTLLNGETGRLDCGTIDGLLLDMAANCGFKEEDL